MGKRVKIAVVNDTHCLSRVALCPPHEISLSEGGYYGPSKSQKWLWQCWEEYWQKVADTPADELLIVSNGDAVEGFHHGNNQLVALDSAVQFGILAETWGVPLDLKPDGIFVVNGTTSHVGRNAGTEVAFASWLEDQGHRLQRDTDFDTPTSWVLQIEREDVLIDFVHQGRTGQRPWTFPNAANLLAADIFMTAAMEGRRYPDIAMRAHYHRWNDSHQAFPTRVVINGCWQYGTNWVKEKIPEHPPGFGGTIITLEDGSYELEKVEFKPKVSRVTPWRG